MKVLILNGSPRKGNTEAAIKAFTKEVNAEVINLNDKAISPCIACDSCGSCGDCVFDDDTNMVINKMMDADFILFATPVYWWGVTAQLKLAIDKLYSKSALFKERKKEIGVIAIGEAELEGPQYGIIEETFKCISDYLGWNMKFYLPISAAGTDDLKSRKKDLENIEALGKKVG